MRPITLLAISALASALLHPQPNTFNSNFTLSPSQIASLNLSASSANNVNVAAQFEQTNWATGSVLDDAFYTDLPANASSAPAGSILKVEPFVDTGNYTIAPALALSRIIYQSKTLNGTKVPVSAYVLWPYLTRGGAKKAPLVSWGHGTSGTFAECAPSHLRNLWYQFSGPYTLALSGYAVVATDYAGLGVSKYPDGSPIVHQYVTSPAAGNDLLYAAQAAHDAFPDKLTREFVVMGHSQGGGAAWAAAQQQLKAKLPGYLGAIAGSPVTNAIEQLLQTGTSLVLLKVAKGIHSIFPDLSLSSMLTDAGARFIDLLENIQGCNSVFGTLVTEILSGSKPEALTHDGFLHSQYAKAWANLAVAGGNDYAGPMLVFHGGNDSAVPESLTSKYVDLTCKRFPHKQLRYVKVLGVGHVPAMYATQQVWLEWLEERFIGDEASHGKGNCTSEEIGSEPPMPVDHYQGGPNYFLEFSRDSYQVA